MLAVQMNGQHVFKSGNADKISLLQLHACLICGNQIPGNNLRPYSCNRISSIWIAAAAIGVPGPNIAAAPSL